MFNILNKLKVAENRNLNVLCLDLNLTVPIDYYLKLKDFGVIDIVTLSSIKASALISKIGQFKNVKIHMLNKVPLKKFDVLAAITLSKETMSLLNYFKPKYVIILDKNSKVKLDNYFEFEANAFKFMPKGKAAETAMKKAEATQKAAPKIVKQEEKDEDVVNDINFKHYYNEVIRDINAVEVDYGKYSIKYINQVELGMVSVIVIVSEFNNKILETIRNLKSQNVGSIEFIIVDNGSGFKSNIKPDIRFAAKQPEDFCVFCAKSLCKGEYMFKIDQDSSSFNIIDAMSKGKFETR